LIVLNWKLAQNWAVYVVLLHYTHAHRDDILSNWKLDKNHQFQASHLPVADLAISYASGIPFLPIRCYLS